MPVDPRPLMVTSALPYANGPIHFGHVTGAYLPADLYTRFQKLVGADVLYICGSDEHGVSITVNAEREGLPYGDYVQRWHHEIKALFDRFDIEFDYFGRTSVDPEHARLSQEFFLRLLRSGAVAPQAGRQHYCTTCERFLPDRYVEGTCYVCHQPAARGDECKACGSWLEAVKITEPHCVTCGNTPEIRDTMQYELDLSHFFDAAARAAAGAGADGGAGADSFPDQRFIDWRDAFAGGRVESGEDAAGHAARRANRRLKTNVQSAIFEKLQHEGDGLRGRPITRDLRWGVPLPTEALDGSAVEGAEGKVLYVWFDAPIGYISATIEWARRKFPNDPAAALAAWRHYWVVSAEEARGPGGPNQAKRLVHFIGKDNIPFHGVVFPSMLAWQSPARADEADRFLGPGPGEHWVLPENVPANEFYNLEGRKFSTSDRWVLDNEAMFERFGVDALRWYLTVSMPETSDSQFRFESLADHVNSELNDTLGNYASRVLKFTHKVFDGRVPEPDTSFVHELPDPENEGATTKIETVSGTRTLCADSFSSAVDGATPRLADRFNSFEFRRAADEMLALARIGNSRFDAQAPWKSRKLDDLSDCRTALWSHLQILSALGVAMWPFMPGASDRLRAMLNQRPLGELLAARDGADSDREGAALWCFEELPAGHALGEPGILFRKIDKAELDDEKAALLPGLDEPTA
ncbi:MAG: methionine--tRNA ligase [Planctomycetota bacterium]|nr:MAG: methionine--tRNA ligase [Planctomycetota bacterium]